MRFEPIKTLPSACPLFLEDAYRHIVDDLRAIAWHWGVPRKASELERFLVRGRSREKKTDFHELRSSHKSYSFLDVFDHAICFKSAYCDPFVLTMPYGDNISFYTAFNEFVTDYYEDKSRIIYAYEHYYPREYSSEEWIHQLFCFQGKIDATIVPNWFKIRENGDFAAIIARDSNLYRISEHGGFPLVNANGSEQ